MTIRIAMWSGPRNLSTAMLRSFGARADCAVADEPLYANFLNTSGTVHPMQEEILEGHETDPDKVLDWLTGPAPDGAAIWYQKQMPHHLLLPNVRRDWLADVRHAVLIRAPERVVASFDAGRPSPSVEDISVLQMDAAIEEIVAATGKHPPVIEAEDVRANPEGMLRALCIALDIPFDPAMLSWEAGRRETDGVWGQHWYHSVVSSTGFAPPPRPAKPLAPHLQAVADAARPSFERLRAMKLTPIST
jgi:hypothetical protein